MYNLINFFQDTNIGHILNALIILLLAFIIATIAKKLTFKLLKRLKLFKKLDDKNKDKHSLINMLSNLVFLIIFLLFVQDIFKILGIQIITTQLYNFLNIILEYLPNILAAIIVLLIGIFIAKIIRQLLLPIFERIKINKLQELAGFEINNTENLSSVLSYVIYILLIIPVIISSLSILNINAISVPAINALSIIFNFIPNIIFATVILIIGFFISKFFGNIIFKLLIMSDIDSKLAKILPSNNIIQKIKISKAIKILTKIIIYIIFIVESLDILQLSILTTIGSVIINYIPILLTAIILIGIAIFLSGLIEKFLEDKISNLTINVVKSTIYIVITFMILNHLGIATEIVNSAFIIILSALGIAFAIAFGIGGREFASNILKKLENSIKKKD